MTIGPGGLYKELSVLKYEIISKFTFVILIETEIKEIPNSLNTCKKRLHKGRYFNGEGHIKLFMSQSYLS